MAEEMKTEQKSEAPIYCKRCGMEVTAKPLTVSEDVLKDYVRATLGGGYFEKTFKIADGKISITFEELPAQLSDKLNDIIKALPPEQAIDKAVDYKLVLTLKKLEIITEDGTVDTRYAAEDAEERYKKINNLPGAFEALASKCNETYLSILRRVSVTFVILMRTITESLLDSDFYTGVGLL